MIKHTDKRKALGNKIKELRKRKGLSQEKLAEMVGLEPPSICYIEVGRNYPTLKNLEKIAEVLGVSFSDIFSFDKYQESEDLVLEINKILKNNPEKVKTFYKILKVITD